jgi:hypothetical protein
LYGTNHGNQTSEKSGNGENQQQQQQQQQQQSCVIGDGNGELILPHFCDMALYLAERAAVRMQSATTRHIVGNHTLPFSPATFVEVRCSCLSNSRSFSLLTLWCQNVDKISHPLSLVSEYGN